MKLGCDIVQVARIKKAAEKKNFLSYVFSKSEQAYFEKYNEPFSVIAGHFAAKEAVAKALGTGFNEHLSFLDITITHLESGAPQVVLSSKASSYFSAPKIEISISHEKDYAMATALLIQKT